MSITNPNETWAEATARWAANRKLAMENQPDSSEHARLQRIHDCCELSGDAFLKILNVELFRTVFESEAI